MMPTSYKLGIAVLAFSNNVNAWVTQTRPLPSRGILVGAQRNSNSHALYVSKHDDNDQQQHWMDSTLQVGRNLIATATMAAVLMGSPDAISSRSHHHFWTPPSSWAAESVLTEGSEPTAKVEGSVLDETWTLIDKYFIDRSFGGQVRQQVRKC